MFTPVLKPGHVASNAELMAIFHCACEGGIRPSNATNSIVLVLNHTKQLHADDWHDNVLWFRGAGGKGDQVLTKGRNRTLLAALTGARPVYLFEVIKPREYTFRGRVEAAGEPFQDNAPDSTGSMRKVWIFPLKLAEHTVS